MRKDEVPIAQIIQQIYIINEIISNLYWALQRLQCHGYLSRKSPSRAQEEHIAVILPGTSLPCGTIVGEIEIQFIGAHRQHCQQQT